jgi:hypothetical protein
MKRRPSRTVEWKWATRTHAQDTQSPARITDLDIALGWLLA